MYKPGFKIIGVKCKVCGWQSKHRNKKCGKCGGEIEHIFTKSQHWKSVLSKFIDRVAVRDNGCWIWKGYCNKSSGYPMLGNKWAHRLSYKLFIGPIPEGHDLHHSVCGNKECVNPFHLLAVTKKGHTEVDLKHPALVNRTKIACPQGHPYNSENTYVDPKGGRHCLTCKNNRLKAKS